MNRELSESMERQTVYRWLSLVWTLFLAYGSLLPLDFQLVSVAKAMAPFQQDLASILQHRSATDWLTNIVIFIPLGFLWFSAEHGGRSLRISKLIVVWAGCIALSVCIEISQSFFATRDPSFADVIANALGSLTGIALRRLLGGRSDKLLTSVWQADKTASPLQSTRRTGALALSCCALLLALWGGLLTTSWNGWIPASNQFQSLSLLPFVRHQAADIFLAIFSTILATVAFAPLGASLWLLRAWPGKPRRARLTWVALLGALSALVLEVLKLFLPSRTPDTGNVVVAALAAAAAYALAPWIWQAYSKAGRTPPQTTDPPLRVSVTTMPEVSGYSAHFFAARLGACICGVATIVLVVNYPLAPMALAIALVCYGALLIRHPSAWLLVVPALLPILDLAPWTGWHYIDEFDAVVLTTLTLGFWRLAGKPVRRPARLASWLPFLGFSLSFMASAAYGILPLTPLDSNALGNPYSPFAGLGMAKAMLLAGGLVVLLRHADGAKGDLKGILGAGMVLGLLGAGTSVIVERLAYAGLADFSASYRAVGLFSTMQTGGAHLDAYLLFALPFAAIAALHAQGKWQRIIALLALAMGTYAVMVTFSRASVAALALEALLIVTALILAARTPTKRAAGGTALAMASLALIGAIVAPALFGTFMQNRIATTQKDMQTRTGHWQDTYAMMTNNWRVSLFGMGVGSFPRTYQVLGQESLRPAVHRFATDGNNSYLGIHNGSTLYVEQTVSVTPRQDYTVSLRARGHGQDSKVNVLLCDRTLLQGYGCQSVTFAWSGSTDTWKRFEARLNANTVGENRWRTAKLSLENASQASSVDIDDVALIDATGMDHVSNGNFQAGANRWHFSSPFNHLPWHIKNIWMEVLFNQGWTGLLLFSALIATATVRLGRRILQGNAAASAMLASMLGLLVVGAFDSILDAPRLIMATMVLLAMPLIVYGQPANQRTRPNQPAPETLPVPQRAPNSARTPLASANISSSVPVAAYASGPAGLRMLAIHVLGLAVGIAVLTRLPFVPYNIRELPNPFHPILAPLLLSFVVFWVFGFPALAARWLTKSGALAIAFPALIAAHGLASWAMLRFAVLPESIHDVIGSPVLNWPWETEAIARMVPLLSVVVMPLTAGALLSAVVNRQRVGAALLWLSFFMLLLLPAQYWVVVTRAGTDNLTELMASDASIGAFATLVTYLLLVGTVGSLLASLHWRAGFARTVVAVAGLLLSLPLGYLLLQAGTEAVLLKQGQMYSAMQFILSTDRTRYATGIELQARYSVFHIAIVILVAWTQRPLWHLFRNWQSRRAGAHSRV